MKYVPSVKTSTGAIDEERKAEKSPTSEVSAATHDGGKDISTEEEGGLAAVLTVIGSGLIYFASFGFMNSFGYFQSFYELDYLANYSSSTIAFIGTLQISLMYFVGPVVGAAFDRWGLKWLYPIGLAGCCGSMLGLSFSQPGQIYQQFLSQGILFGLSVSFGVQPALAVIGQHFKKHRAMAMGLAAGGSSIGGVCLPIMFARMVPKIGFGWTIRLAMLIFFCCFVGAMLMSRTKSPSGSAAVVRKPLRLGTLFDFSGYKDPRYLVLAIGCFSANLGLYVPYYYIEPYALLRHPESSIHSYLLPLINGLGFFGRILGGFVADRIGRLNLLYPMTFVSGIFSLAMWLPADNVATIIAFICLYGFSSGIFISVMPAVVAQISPDDKIGARIGALFTLAGIATLIGTPVAGSLVNKDADDGYRSLILFGGLTHAAGGALFLLARFLCDGDLRTKW